MSVGLGINFNLFEYVLTMLGENKKNKQKSPGRFGGVLSKIDFSQREKGIFEKALCRFEATDLADLTM
jgi:hypothetical protein